MVNDPNHSLPLFTLHTAQDGSMQAMGQWPPPAHSIPATDTPSMDHKKYALENHGVLGSAADAKGGGQEQHRRGGRRRPGEALLGTFPQAPRVHRSVERREEEEDGRERGGRDRKSVV